jgi:CRP-like cAMP-binding protein
VTENKKSIFKQGETANYFYIVTKGIFKLHKTVNTNKDLVLNFSGEGDVIAALIMPNTNPIYPISATSIGVSQSLKIPRDDYLNLWLQDSHLVRNLQNLVQAKMSRIHEDKEFSTMSVEAKLAHFLLKFSGNEVSNDTFLSSVTRKDIANAIGTTPESVMRTLSAWSKKGIISESDKKLKIIDFDQMKLISEDI